MGYKRKFKNLQLFPFTESRIWNLDITNSLICFLILLFLTPIIITFRLYSCLSEDGVFIKQKTLEKLCWIRIISNIVGDDFKKLFFLLNLSTVLIFLMGKEFLKLINWIEWKDKLRPIYTWVNIISLFSKSTFIHFCIFPIICKMR